MIANQLFVAIDKKYQVRNQLNYQEMLIFRNRKLKFSKRLNPDSINGMFKVSMFFFKLLESKFSDNF